MIQAARSQLLLIDLQERLLPAMAEAQAAKQSCVFLAEAAGHCGVPTLISEQYPKGLGPTDPEIVQASSGAKIVAKTAFSAAGEPKLLEKLRKKRTEQQRDQLIIAGIEAHVCVLQSALELSTMGFTVFVVADAITSRKLGSRDVALSRLAHAGVVPVTSEMVAFEWVGDAKSKAFKPISTLVRAR